MNTDTELREDVTEYVMPCAEAMLACTLALMTGHAESNSAPHRALMARKISSHLFHLGQHPGLTPNFRSVVQRMHGHWGTLLAGCEAVLPTAAAPGPADLLPEQRLWHRTAAQVH